MKIGINGFGRIGKSLFLQLLFDNTYDFELSSINAIHLTIDQIENYQEEFEYSEEYKNDNVQILEELQPLFQSQTISGNLKDLINAELAISDV